MKTALIAMAAVLTVVGTAHAATKKSIETKAVRDGQYVVWGSVPWFARMHGIETGQAFLLVDRKVPRRLSSEWQRKCNYKFEQMASTQRQVYGTHLDYLDDFASLQRCLKQRAGADLWFLQKDGRITRMRHHPEYLDW